MATKSELLIAALQDAGLKPRSYSGRGMNGEECIGVSAESAYSIGAAIQDVGAPEPKQDQLGKRYIFYWPSYPWPVPEAPLAAAAPKPDPVFIDLTPRGCETPEGQKRVKQAQDDFDEARENVARVATSVRTTLYAIRSAASDKTISSRLLEYFSPDDLIELIEAIEARMKAENEFMRAVAGR